MQAVIDIKTFYLWLKDVQNVDFLSDAEKTQRTEAYQELESDEVLDLQESMKEW